MSIKRWSTGRIGNTFPEHLQTDHVNTKGLDNRGLPGIESYIDEDVVRAYDDSRPLINLLSNDEMLSRSADSRARSFDHGAYLKNDNDDWRLTIGAENYYSDPEDFTRQITITPLQIAKGVAYAPNSGIISTGYKKIAGFRRDDGTSLWVDEHDWYYNTNITLDDPETSYVGYYRPVYVELPESTLPSNFKDYQINVRQLTSTGAIYTYPIYLQKDLIIPFRSSTFAVEDEQVDFASSDYPGYDFYPESFIQLESSGLGVLEIGEDTEVTKYLKKEEHKLLASQFNSKIDFFTSELKSNIFRDSKSANINRIENDVNFIRSMEGIKAYNGSSRVYFNDFKNLLGVLQPLKDSRHFLGNQELSFEIAFVDTPGDQYGNFKVVRLTSPETRGFQDFGVSKADPDAALSIANNTYKFGIQLNNDTSPTTVEVDVVTTDSLRDIRDKINAEFSTNSIYAHARVWDDSSNWELRIYSRSSGNYSKVLLSTGTPDLGAALGSVGYETPDNGQTDWEIFYDESAPSYYYAERTSGSTLNNDFDSEDVGYKLFNALIVSGFDNFIVGIDTTTSLSHSCELYIEPSTTHTQGYQELGMNVPDTGIDSGLLPLSEYYFKLNIDGLGMTEYSIITTTDVTYSGVVNVINDVLDGKALLTFTGTNDVKISSDSYGPTSSILTADGTTGNSLFGFAYPATGFPPAAQHSTPVAGTGKLIYIRPRTIDSFTVFEDSVVERVVYAHSDSILFVTPDTKTDIRDHVDTEHAYITGTGADRWSTHNDRVVQIDLSNHASWQTNAIITKVSTIITNSIQYLLVGNDSGQIFFRDNTSNLYDDDFDPDDFTLFISSALGQDSEKINNFFLYNDGGSKKYLFILADSFVYHSDVTSGLTAGQTFTAIDTSSSSDVPNVSDEIFSQINDVIDWDVDVNSSNTNKYLIFVGDSDDSSSWLYAPILYAIYSSTGFTFDWYADEIYRKEQINDITAIEKYNGWMDSEQDYQVFITNNANGPEVWAGNSLNNWQNIGGGGDERFDRFSWIESNLELGKNSLEVDSDLDRLNTLEIFDNKIFAGGSRISDTYSGFYSYGITKLQKYFAVDVLENIASSDGERLFSSVYRGSSANSDPAILVISEELDDGRVQVFSQDDLSTVSNWPSDSSFRIFMNGFSVGEINYDGEYNVIFSGQGKSNLSELIDAINGSDIDNAGFAKAVPISNPLITVDITPVIRAKELISYEKFGNTYTERYKLVIESKVADVGEAGGHTSTEETTQSDCYITINNPTTGTSVVGTGSDTIEIDPGTTGYANLQLVDWNAGKAFQVKRVSSTSLSFSGNTYVNISSILASGYSLLTGSLRLKANATDEIGWAQGVGRILKTDTTVSLNSITYTFEIQFNENLTPTGAVEVTPVTCPGDSSGSLSGTYWLLNSPTEFYYVWYDVDNNSTDPEISGRVGIEVDIATGNAATTVATNTATAIATLVNFGATPSGTLVTVTNADEGNVIDAIDGNAGVTIGSITQGASSAPIRNYVEIDGSTIFDIQDLLDAINVSLSGGVASLQAVGGTAEYCDIVIVSNYVGDDSSVEIKLASFGAYLFGLTGIDTTLNEAISGSTILTTAGSQTFGYTWENADYFVEYDHPDTSQIRIYIPNGTTRLDTGATIWLDFWQWKELTKISAKTGSPPINNIPLAGEWTYNLEEKKIVVKEQPSLTAPEDYIFVDVKIQKVLRLLDLGVAPTDQTELSDEFHAIEPRNLTNSDVSVARSLARLSALHYGVLLWSTDTDDSVLADYSFFLPRLDILSVKKEQDEYGNRVHFIKGRPDSEAPWIELPLIEQDKKAYLYTTFVNSQDYEQNDILSIPWYLSTNLQRGVIYLNGTSQYFKPNNDLVSTRGLAATRGSASVSKIALNGDYDLVKITDPIGIYNERRRISAYTGIDASQTIFVNTVAGNDLNDGFTKNSAKLTIQNAIDITSDSRPYVFVQAPVDGSKISITNFNINRSFKIYLIAEKILSAAIISVQGECYLEGIETLTSLKVLTSKPITIKYCDFQSIEGDTTPGVSVAGHNIEAYNSIVRDGYTTQTENMTDDISIIFDHVYVAESATIFTFNSVAYSIGKNTFVFNNVTNNMGSSGNIVECPESIGISIEFNKCLLPSGTSSTFNSNASIVINESMVYAVSNSGTGSVIVNDSQPVSSGDINVISATGASESIARGYSSDSLALNYINREEDPGAFLEERILSTIKNNEQHSSNESYLDFENTRTQFRYDIMSDKFSFFMRFKPLLNYQQTGVLFDSRYDGDFNYVSGLFNQNATDFVQIVYDNKTYERNELTADKYSFKFITSNGSSTSISVIGPYFTVSDNTEYNQWHEIGILMYYQDTYNNKYESANIGNEDKERKQMVIFTMFDRDIDRAYTLKNEPYEDASGNEIPTTMWYPENAIGRFFNVGGGWDATWFSTASGKEWSTWSESRYSMVVDDFLVSSDIIPLNILKDFGAKEKIDIKENDFRIARYDDKNAGIILHCDNPHPYSENGLQPYDTANVSFRQYEGFESHGVAIEHASPNLVVDGRIKRGDWFDRSEARVWDATTDWITWGNVSGLDGILVAIIAENSGGDLFIKYVDPVTGSVDSSVQILSGASLSEVKALVVGSRIVIAYIDGSSQFKFKTYDGTIQGGPYTINAAATSYISMCGGHSSSQVAFAYRNNTATLGYAKIMRTDNGTVVTAATSFTAGADITHNAITETTDKDGNLSYTFFYRLFSSSWLNFVMYEEDLTATVFPPDTLITGEEPIDIKTTTFIDGQIFVKWKDYNVGANSPVKAAYLNREGTELEPPFEVFSTASPNSMTDDFVQQRDFKVLLAAKDRVTGDIHFRLYQEVGTTVGEATNSPYLRDFDEVATNRIFLGLPTEGSIAMATTINDGTYDAGNVIELETDIPSRWFKDFTGVYDEFSVSAEKTRTLFGWAYYHRFNHQQSIGETSAYHVASAEESALVPPWTTYASSDGSFAQTTEAAVHGTKGYTLAYNGTGANVRLTKSGAWGTDKYARFYLKVDKFFSLTGSDPKQIEIARLGTTGGDDLILLLEYNDPLLGGDGKFKLVAKTTAYGTATTATSIINYSTNHIIEMRYHINAAGGWEIWSDEVSVLSNATNTSAETGITSFRIGSATATSNTPSSSSKLYFDSIKVDDAYISAYTAGLGQGEIWQDIAISTTDVHFIGLYYWIISGSWVMRLEGSALTNPIEFTFNLDDDDPYVHETVTQDTVEFVENYEINFNKIRRHVIKFIPDNTGTINVRLKSTESSVGDQIDEFYVDNVKVEENKHPTSIEAEQDGYLEYPYAMKSKGSVFLRIIPEFFDINSGSNHTLFSAYTQDETGSEYISHELYYDEAVSKFKFYITDLDGTVAQVESDEYGTAPTQRQLTDLRSKHNIVCHWDVEADYIDLRIDNEQYTNNNISLGDFSASITTLVGNRKTKAVAADCIYDLIRFGEEPFGYRQVEDFSRKRDPFFHQNKTDIGSVNVKSFSFFGLTSADQFEKTIYTEPINDSWRLVIDKGNEFASEVTIRHDGEDIIVFGTTGVTIDGSLSVGTLIATTVATINTTDDHLTLRYGFSGSPPLTNDGYFEIERGNIVNSELRWDESHKAWTVHDGIINKISIDGISIGTWQANDNFNIASNGTGSVKVFTNSSTDAGGGDGTKARTTGTERASFNPGSIIINDLGNDVDFIVESISKPYMLFVNAGSETVTVGRTGGTIPAAAKTDHDASLAVNRAMSIVSSVTTYFGTLAVYDNSGNEGGYIGYGSPTASPSYWEIKTVDADEVRISGGDMVFNNADSGISFLSDRTNSRLAYTADAPNQTTGTSIHGVYCHGSMTAYRIYHSVWNDYAEAFEFDKTVAPQPQPGYVYKMTENGIIPTERRVDPATVGVYSDTYGQLMGSAGIFDEEHPDGTKLPIGLMGKIRVWVKEELEIGAPLVSDVGGFATEATGEERRNYPDLIIGKVLEVSKDNSAKRIWILIK